MVQGRKINDDELVEISGGVDDLNDLDPKSLQSSDSNNDSDPEAENPGGGNQEVG